MRRLYLLFSLSFSTFFLHAQNNALSFDGVDDYVECGNNAAFNANTIRTMEGWVKFNSLTGDQEIFSKSTGSLGIELLLFNNALSVFCMNGPDYSIIQYPVSNLQTGKWYHIAFSWNGTKETPQLYVNGIAVGTKTNGGDINVSGVSNSAGSFRIGQWCGTPSRPFNGLIDEVRIWNVQRTAAQIKSGMYAKISSATGLVAYYGANEGIGSPSLINGTATAGLDGTLVNGATRTGSPVQYSSNALNFDGVDDQVVVPANSLFDLATGTVECWIKPGLMNYNGCFAGNRGSTNTRYSFHINTTTNTIGLFNGSVYNTVSYAFTPGQWYHVAFVCNGMSTSVYINGSPAGTIPSAFSTTATGQPFVIGVGKNSTGIMEPFLGEIDEVRVWNTQRTQTEIQNYKDKSITGSEAGLVALYTFNQGSASGLNTGLVTLTDITANNNHGTLSGFALTGASSNFTSNAMTILPVKLVGFTATRNKSEVILQWQTAVEQGSKEFSVERSVDGIHYVSIGTVAAFNQNDKAGNYSYSDANPVNGTSYYRLKIIDRDLASIYSPVRTIRWNSGRLLTCAADAGGNVLLSLENGTNEPYSISDLSGRRVAEGKLVQGQARIYSLQAGVYVATSGNGSENLQVKFMVRK